MLLSSHDQAGRLRLPDRSAVRLSEMDDIVIKTFPEGFESVLLSQSRLILFRIRRMVKIKLEFVCDSAKGILAELDTLRNQLAISCVTSVLEMMKKMVQNRGTVIFDTKFVTIYFENFHVGMI